MAEGGWRGAEPGGGRLTAGAGVGGGRAVGTARLLDIVAAVWEAVMGWGWGSAQSYQTWRDSATLSQNSWPMLSKKNIYL